MRTVQSDVMFHHPFTLSRDVGELPAGTYEIEVDEEEISLAERAAYRRTAIHLYVQRGASTRVVQATPSEFDAALDRDANWAAGESKPLGISR